MAITRLNSLAIPAGTVEPADISYPLTNFSSTGIDDNATNTALTITSNGMLGIGTTSTSGIQGLLHIHSSSGDNSDGDGEVNFGDESTVIISTNATNAGGQGYYGSLFFGGQDINSETQQVWKLAGFSAYSAPDLGTIGSADLLFYTTSSSSTPTERMRIDASGKLLVGTDSTSFHDRAQITVNPFLTNHDGLALVNLTGDVRYGFIGKTGSVYSYRGVPSDAIQIRADSRDLSFLADDGNITFHNSGNERARINTSGNVGIGTTDPQELIHAMGTIVAAPVLFSADQDEAYLIAGSQNYSGANTNWGTYGFQHRIKTNSSGVPRITVDTQQSGEAFTILNNGRIGINEVDPQHKLDIQGAAAGINIDGGGTNSYINLVEAGDTGFQISYDGSSSNDFQIKSGFSGTLTTNRMKIGRDTGRWENFATGGNPTLRNTQTSSVANNGTVDFSIFSGMIIINTIGVSGDCAVWVCGSSQTTKLGSSTGTTAYTLTYVSGINGYRFTNTSGQTNTYSFMAFQTRANA